MISSSSPAVRDRDAPYCTGEVVSERPDGGSDSSGEELHRIEISRDVAMTEDWLDRQGIADQATSEERTTMPSYPESCKIGNDGTARGFLV
jgi:hypothetical protein